jgi:hypothetical protein
MAGRPKKIREINLDTINKPSDVLITQPCAINLDTDILRKDVAELKDQLAQAIAEGRGMVGVYEAIEAIKNRLVDVDRLEEKVNLFIQKVEKIHENRGCQL